MNVADSNSETFSLQPLILPNAKRFTNIHEIQQNSLAVLGTYIHFKWLY